MNRVCAELPVSSFSEFSNGQTFPAKLIHLAQGNGGATVRSFLEATNSLFRPVFRGKLERRGELGTDNR